MNFHIIKLFAFVCFFWSCSTTYRSHTTSTNRPHASHKLYNWDVPKSKYPEIADVNPKLKYHMDSEETEDLQTHENEWDALELVWPTSGTLTSKYGMRKLRKHVRMHKGIDIGAQTGTPVYAAETGRVKFRGRMRGYGSAIILKHDSVHDTLYAHLSRIVVKNNQVVRKNQLIGYVGRTGYTTGSNLHFEMRVNGTARDPLQFLPMTAERKKVRVGEAILIKNRRIATKSGLQQDPKG